MNVAFFLTPKSEVVCLTPNSTMRQALEVMEYHRYTAIPLINEHGKYVGTLTEGDLLWKLKSMPELNLRETSTIMLKEVPRYIHNKPVSIVSDIEDLISLAVNQNFVPVVDDHEVFIGIIRRSEIINYCFNAFFKKE